MKNEVENPHLPKAHIIVVGNEKGGAGKSTIAIHMTVALMRMGFNVGSIDIDGRQLTLTHYIEHRRDTWKERGGFLPIPHHAAIHPVNAEPQAKAAAAEQKRFGKAVGWLRHMDFIVIDAPGADNALSRLAHYYADTIVTPLNDSFVDLDMLAQVEKHDLHMLAKSPYSVAIAAQRQKRAEQGAPPIRWIVLRNRLTNLTAHNKQKMQEVLVDLAGKLDFTLVAGFAERVIFREMFLDGLTVADIVEERGDKKEFNLSHLAAMQEVRGLLRALAIREVLERLHMPVPPDARTRSENFLAYMLAQRAQDPAAELVSGDAFQF